MGKIRIRDKHPGSATLPTSELSKTEGASPGADNGYNRVRYVAETSRYNRKRIQLVADIIGSGNIYSSGSNSKRLQLAADTTDNGYEW